MRFSFNTRTKRRTVHVMLFVWLFALGSAWANACLLQDGRAHLHGSDDGEVLGVQAVQVSPGHLGVDSDHPENAGSATSACLKVCGDESQSPVKVTLDVEPIDAAMAPPMAVAWGMSSLDGGPDLAWMELPAPSPGLPLRTRFSRLAL